jgi:hypothetical protein
MSQRDSGYARHENDVYETPSWVTAALLAEGFRSPQKVWESAAGSGKMRRVLKMLLPCDVMWSDISAGDDFMKMAAPPDCDCIVTNPPYGIAPAFIARALKLMKPVNGQVMMLLRTDFDHAKTRKHLFADCPAFAKKLVLTKRIRWIEDSTGSPSFNHAWFFWDWRHTGPPTLAYGP